MKEYWVNVYEDIPAYMTIAHSNLNDVIKHGELAKAIMEKPLYRIHVKMKEKIVTGTEIKQRWKDAKRKVYITDKNWMNY